MRPVTQSDMGCGRTYFVVFIVQLERMYTYSCIIGKRRQQAITDFSRVTVRVFIDQEEGIVGFPFFFFN